ncbi:MAG: Gfo/Idh/MocA family oxidoreductase [Bacteroidales bacterium]
MKKLIFLISVLFISIGIASGQKPVKIGIAGLSHSHVVPLLRDMERSDIKIVGIAESDSKLAERYAERFGFDPGLVYGSLEKMLDKSQPEGVITFTSIFDHLKVVEACASRGIHVMVEKPLAVSVAHAEEISRLAGKHNIMVLTNYETSWYPSVHKGRQMIAEGKLGVLRKVIVYDGHTGPKEIRINEEFLDWLTDPVLNGGGAVIDFGCYGANLVTWILDGRKPESVFASLKQYKPDIYTNVDDDATIILNYPDMECVIHASWNWPFNRKDMHIYGSTGYLFQDDAATIRYRLERKSPEQTIQVASSTIPYTDPFTWFADVIQGKVTVKPTDLASLEINQIVVEILDAAKESDRTGKTVFLNK